MPAVFSVTSSSPRYWDTRRAKRTLIPESFLSRVGNEGEWEKVTGLSPPFSTSHAGSALVSLSTAK